MDNQRLIIWAVFGLLAFWTWEAWQQDYGPKPAPVTPPPAVEATEPAQDTDVPTLTDGELSAGDSTPLLSPEEPAATPAAEAVPVPPAAQLITVSTDVFDIQINTVGGVLQGAVLKQYPVEKDRPDEPVRLLGTGDELATIQAGLTGVKDEGARYFNAQLGHERSRYEMNGDGELVVPLTWDNGAGVTITKRLRFKRGSYRIDVEHEIRNASDKGFKVAQYAVLKRRSLPIERSMFDVESYSFNGTIIYDGEKSEKLDRDDLQKSALELTAANAWVGSIQHHFVRAIVPPENTDFAYRVNVSNNIASAAALGPSTTVPAGADVVLTDTLFVGPKLQAQLGEIAESLTLTVDYGWLTFLSDPLFWLLSWIYGFVGNWGVAIILVTILIKMVFYKLTEKSGRSMAKMRELQPRMQALQERYKDDRQQLGIATMELYKREGANPAAGCLPILIQMPFFLAFYWVLLESVEMRQAPFALWITDLSTRDPYFILPIIMGAAMLFQQKLNPAPTDPVQAKVMQIMPIMFTGFFAFFPSGLVLYWVTNTVLSIAQQWYVNKVVEEESRARKGKNKKPKE